MPNERKCGYRGLLENYGQKERYNHVDDVKSCWRELLLIHEQNTVSHDQLVSPFDHSIFRRLSIFFILLASIIPGISIIALNFIPGQVIRLVVVNALSALFAVFVRLCSSARTSDIFAATLAFVFLYPYWYNILMCGIDSWLLKLCTLVQQTNLDLINGIIIKIYFGSFGIL